MKATGQGINAPPGLKGFSFHLQPAGPDTNSAFELNQPGQYCQLTGSCRQPLVEIGNLLHGKDQQGTVGTAGKENAQARPMDIVFQAPTKHDARSSYFALLTPAADHVAALCLQPLLSQAPNQQELDANSQAAGRADRDGPACDEQAQSPEGRIKLASHQCHFQNLQHDIQGDCTHLIGATHIPSGFRILHC